MLAFTDKEKKLFKKLNTPAKVQDFLNKLKFNLEKDGVDTIKSPLRVLRVRNAHCIEGAIFGAYVLSLHGFTPYLICLKAAEGVGDDHHVIVPFKVNGFWGALSKTNHIVLRYREPVYKNIRELCMSYFHEYFLENGKKTLRKYSALFNLNTLKTDWVTADKDLWYIDKALDKVRYYDIVPKSYLNKLRLADKIERQAIKIVEYKNVV